MFRAGFDVAIATTNTVLCDPVCCVFMRIIQKMTKIKIHKMNAVTIVHCIGHLKCVYFSLFATITPLYMSMELIYDFDIGDAGSILYIPKSYV